MPAPIAERLESAYVVEGRLSGGAEGLDDRRDEHPGARSANRHDWLAICGRCCCYHLAAMAAIYDGNDTMITNAPVSHAVASAG